MVTFDAQQKQLLKEIMNDKFSNGAFSGMVFNAYVQFKLQDKDKDPELMDRLIKTALVTRLRLKELSE